jgi:hypothetical protein
VAVDTTEKNTINNEKTKGSSFSNNVNVARMKVCIVIVVIRKEEGEETVSPSPWKNCQGSDGIKGARTICDITRSCVQPNMVISVLKLLLADPRVDKASIDHTDTCDHTALWYTTNEGCSQVATLLISDSRTSWDSVQ